MQKALITGIDGFTGRYLTAELSAAGYDVYGISKLAQPQSPNVYPCDICDCTSLTEVVSKIEPDLVFHLAAIAFVPHDDVDAIYRTNIVGTRNLLHALSLCGKPHKGLLLVSSANVYGNANVDAIDEATPPAPTNDYAVSKLAMEYMAMLWAAQQPITIARTFNYTGVGQSVNFLLPKIVDHFKRRASLIELGNLDAVRDFSDVRTVVQCYVRLLQTAAAPSGNRLRGERFNICSGRGHRLLDIVEMASEISGHSLQVNVSPAVVRSNDVKTLVGSRAKLESAIGPINDLPLADTLRWMLAA